MAKKNSDKKVSVNYLEKLETNVQQSQSKVSLVLGALIVIVLGVLIFNYFNKAKPSLGPAQQVEEEEQKKDVTQDKLPGPYTVKQGDTLFLIAQNYYQDGSKYLEIAKANNLASPDNIETGQVLELPKVETLPPQASPSPVAASEEPSTGTGGGDNTIWGPRIEGSTYTVVEDDWLSKIAGRSYGDIMAFDKIAKANNIPNPDHIEPGRVLTIPR